MKKLKFMWRSIGNSAATVCFAIWSFRAFKGNMLWSNDFERICVAFILVCMSFTSLCDMVLAFIGEQSVNQEK